MSPLVVAGIGLTLFLGSALQGAVGFAFGLFAIPLLVWLGVSLGEAVALMSISIFVQVLVGTWQLRREVRWREVWLGTAIRYATLPLGLALLLWVDGLDRAQIKQVLGALVLAALLVQIFAKVEPRNHLPLGWTLAAFSGSGIMQGLAAMGGPPVVLWVMAHHWSSKESRAFMLALFLLVAPLQMALLYLTSPHNVGRALLTGLLFSPLVALGAVAGVRLGNRIDKELLRRLAYGLLFVTAAVSILSPAF
ncbi:MAG: sulfite exporter TauE/SafE family protein [Anaerolineae bacterium]